MTKSIYKLVMALFAIVAFTACSDSDNDYQKATVTGNQVYFANTLPSTINISFDESTFEIPILRYVADEAITVNLELEDTTGFYSIPASVSFAQGEKEAKIVVTYDNEALEYNKYIEATVKITSAEYTTPYGYSSYTFSAGTPLTYTPLGTGTFIDNWFGANTKDYFEVVLTSTNTKNSIQKAIIRIDRFNYQPKYIMMGGSKADIEIKVTSYKKGKKQADSVFRFNKKNYPNADIIDLR